MTDEEVPDGPWYAGAVGRIPEDDCLVYRDDAVHGPQFYAATPEDAEAAARQLNAAEARGAERVRREMASDVKPRIIRDGVRWAPEAEVDVARARIAELEEALAVCGRAGCVASVRARGHLTRPYGGPEREGGVLIENK